MKRLLSILSLTLAFFHLPLAATPPLSTQDSINSAFTGASFIFRGVVLTSKSQWLCGDEEITEAEAFEVENAYLKHNEEHLDRFGAESDEPAARAHAEAWTRTRLGSRFMKKITGIHLVTIRCDSVIKGGDLVPGSTITLAWSTGILQTCSHVMVPTEAGKEVLVFLFKDWRDHLPVISEHRFLLGSPTMKPTAEAGPATAPSTPSEPDTTSWPPNE